MLNLDRFGGSRKSKISKFNLPIVNWLLTIADLNRRIYAFLSSRLNSPVARQKTSHESWFMAHCYRWDGIHTGSNERLLSGLGWTGFKYFFVINKDLNWGSINWEYKTHFNIWFWIKSNSEFFFILTFLVFRKSFFQCCSEDDFCGNDSGRGQTNFWSDIRYEWWVTRWKCIQNIKGAR